MNDILSTVRNKTREFLNPYIAPFRRYILKRHGGSLDFTIISNNCWAGHVYRYFGLPYNTPTVGLFFFAEDYVKFVYNLKHYIDQDISFISVNESNYYKELKDNNINCPIGKIDDIEIVFLHYSSEEEAQEKWNRRRERICWNNIIFKMSEQNKCSEKHVQMFDQLPEERKFIFVSKNYFIESQVLFYEYIGKGSVDNDTSKFRKYIDLIHLLSGKPFKLHQKI